MVRHVLGAFAEALRLPDDLVEDMRLAVTEACTNVVRHAYPAEAAGPSRSSIRPDWRAASSVIVSDHGRGIGPEPGHAGSRPRPAADRGARRLVEIEPVPGGGQPRGDVVRPARAAGRRVTASPSGADAPTTVSIAAGPLVGPILRRVVGMLAARADLPLDRLDDAVLVADLIAARAPAHVLHGDRSTWPSSPARARSRCASARCAPAAATR